MRKIFDVRLQKEEDGQYKVLTVSGKRLNDLPFMYVTNRGPIVFLNETKSNHCLVLKVESELFYIKAGDTLHVENAIILVKTIEDCNAKIIEMLTKLDLSILDPYIEKC